MKSSKQATITFRLSEELKSQIEVEAAERGMTTSQWLGHAAIDTLARDNKVLQAHRDRYKDAIAEHEDAGKALKQLTEQSKRCSIDVLGDAVDRLSKAGRKLQTASFDLAHAASKYVNERPKK
jgi:antitoxin component of RelBE/YafQ-DinJ toxin-antitoxin module